MAQSSLLGIDRAARRASGTDAERLGPSDTTDSGSDVIGTEISTDQDPGLPADAALDADARHLATTAEAIGGGIDADALEAVPEAAIDDDEDADADVEDDRGPVDDATRTPR